MPPRDWRSSPMIKSRAHDLRSDMPAPEQKLWVQLRANRLGGWHFRRQHPIGPFIVDFFCAQAGLVIEIDGDTHAEQEAYDAERTRWLTGAKGYQVLRFANPDVMQNIEGVVEAIRVALADRGNRPSP